MGSAKRQGGLVADDTPYQPERGDFVYLEFSPTVGTEQRGRRPALVISPSSFNIATSLAFVCPLTSRGTGSEFEVAVPATARIKGYVLSHQVRVIDWLARNIQFHARAPNDTLMEVLARIEAILMISLDDPDQPPTG